jgi:hypothetical protein
VRRVGRLILPRLGRAGQSLSVRDGCEHVFEVAYPDYVRVKAQKLRVEKRLSIGEIAERLALPKTTIY